MRISLHLDDAPEDDEKALPPHYSDDPEAHSVDWSLEIEEPDPIPRRFRRKRYLHAAVFALFFLIFLPVTFQPFNHLVLKVSRFVVKHLTYKTPPVDRTYSQESCIRYADWTIDTDADSHPGNHTYQAQASFDLRISSHLLYFISRGSPELIRGSIDIVDSGTAGSDVATVDVTALYDSRDDFLLTQTCWLRPEFDKKENRVKNGLGIFGPYNWERPKGAHRMSFDIKVRLPRQRMGMTFLREFETDLPMFAHHVGDLEEGFQFEYMRLRTEGMPIHVESFIGPTCYIENQNGEIAGNFAAHLAVHLQGSNTSIKANVTLHNSHATRPTRLWMQTDEREIESNVTLQAHGHGVENSAFTIGAFTTRSPVRLAVPEAPPHAQLEIRGRTTDAPLRAQMHAAFEGALRLSSGDARGPAVLYGDAEDPARLARHREVVLHRTDGGVDGDVRWVPSLQGSPGVIDRAMELSTTGDAPLEVVLS